MEYEFLRNTMSGTSIARFSMEHEALGQWFSEELSDNAEFYVELCQMIAQLQSGQCSHWRAIGRGLSLELDSEQARVFANTLENGEEIELEDAMSFYDGESEAFCGLEDFYSVLISWRKFLDESA